MTGRQTALVTGATGFVGSHLAHRLIADGWQVSLVIRRESRLDAVADLVSHTALYEHDGSTENLESIVGKVKPDVVFHLASLFLARHDSKDVEPLIRSNILFGAQLLESMARHGVRSLVNAGTAWQHYGDKPYDPVCLYAATKQAFEDILAFYTSDGSLSAITLKLFDTYGPGDLRPKLFTLLRTAAQQRTTLKMSPGEQLIDLVFIDDVVEAFVMAAARLLNGAAVRIQECFAVSSGHPVRLRDLVTLYSQVSGHTVAVEWGGRPYREREVMIPWTGGQPLPGWHPTVGLEDGIRRMETGRLAEASQ